MVQLHAEQWNFIVSLYAKPQIKDACLALQDIGGVDIPVLLAAIYASEKRNIRLKHEDIMEMDRLSDPVSTDYIQPLRAMRIALKNASSSIEGAAPQTLRAKILEAELLAEREQLALLADYIGSRPTQPDRLDVDATVELVCNFYFKKNVVHTHQIQQLNPSLLIFSRTVSLMG